MSTASIRLILVAAVAAGASCGVGAQIGGPPAAPGKGGASGADAAADVPGNPPVVDGSPSADDSGSAPMDVGPTADRALPPADAPAPEVKSDAPAMPNMPAGPAGPWARNLRVGLVELAQGPFIKVGDAGAAIPVTMRNAPVVEGRPFFARVHVATDAGFTARALRGVLTVTYTDNTKFEIEDAKMISAASAVDRLDSTFNFLVPAENVKPGSTAVASIYEMGAAVGAEPAMPPRFPATATADLGVKAGRMEMWVVAVPGSASLIVTPDRLKKVENDVWDLYPVQKVNVRVRAPITYTGTFSSAKGFTALTQAREMDGAKPWEYYHLFVQANLGFLGVGNRAGATAADGSRRVAMTILSNMNVDGSTNSTAHELGHNHGRAHTPGCGAAGPDSMYPYMMPPGDAGVNGYSLTNRAFKSRTLWRDLMSYCRPQGGGRWISDYVWRAFEERVRIVTAFNTGVWSLQDMTSRSLQGFVDPGEKPLWTVVSGDLVDGAAAITATRYAVLTLADGRRVKTAVTVNELTDHVTQEYALNLGGSDYSDGDVIEAEVVVDGTRSVVPVSGLARYR
ncbi:MAG TPA: hypothetical protein VFH73_02420 [Polyangia bacterium]|nr:hypothetical protein [Polyangia bacterium]